MLNYKVEEYEEAGNNSMHWGEKCRIQWQACFEQGV